jgi:hypothetical protein
MTAKPYVALEHIVSFGGERMTRGEMIRHLHQTARATGHLNPQLLVDRYLQGWEAGLTLADHAELWCQEQGRKLPPRHTPEWTAMYEAWHAFAFRDFKEAVLPHHRNETPLAGG